MQETAQTGVRAATSKLKILAEIVRSTARAGVTKTKQDQARIPGTASHKAKVL